MAALKFTSPLLLKLKLSRVLVGLLVFIHVGACGLLFVLPWQLMPKLFFVLLLCVNLFFVLRKLPGLTRSGNIQTLEWAGDGNWYIKTFAGKELAAQLQPSSFVHSWLVILNFRLQEQKRLHSVVLFFDALDKETLRRLRVRLGIEGGDISRLDVP